MTAGTGLDEKTRDTYREAMSILAGSGVEILVGGSYAFERYTGISRHTKDFDVFLRQEDLERALESLTGAGFRTDVLFPHWLGKAYKGEDYVDLIFGAGNGIATVDDLWFRHSVPELVLGMPARICPAEEMIWSKAFIMERERFDGADVAHLFHARAGELDWARLLRRFDPFPQVLLAHLILFGFIYPDRKDSIPRNVMDGLLERLGNGDGGEKVCYGTLLSRAQYIVDIGHRGYRDARLEPIGTMRAEDVAWWTSKIEGER